MGRKLLVWMMLLVPGISSFTEPVQLQFNWAFVKRAPNGSVQPIDFSERVNIAQGDLFKINIQPVKDAFLYLFLHDASGDLQLLFPDRFEQFESRSYKGKQFFIPVGENWFTLDSAKGTERFYLLASSKRLSSLESLTIAYQSAAQARSTNAPAADAARQAVLDEISRVRKENSKLTIAAEKPVTIAGGTRGVNSATAKLATEIDAQDFYTKTFRLEH
jgi:hypothetical protein